MKKLCKYYPLQIGILGALIIVPSLIWAGVIGKNTLLRHYEPLILQGSTLPLFAEVNVNHLFTYAYSDSLKQWIQIPCQIDERDANGSYYNSDDGHLDDNDELVFMAKDLGDRVSANTWIDDEESKNYPRYEITVTDPLDLTKQAWVYLYRSSTLVDTVTTDYISYDPSADKIITPYYELDHDDNAVPVDLVIPLSGDGNGQDILDRQKTRVKGKYIINYTVNEKDNLLKTNLRYIDGRIRVLRKVWFDLRIRIPFLGWYTVTSFDLTTRYYPFSTVAGGGTGTLKSDWGISLIRQSNDFNTNAVRMVWYNPFNPRTIIDGNSDVIDPTLTLPGLNWVLITGDPGSIAMIVDMPLMANTTQGLYYWDRSDGGTGDGTSDTGDGRSYGDIGVLITGSNISGTFGFGLTTFYLPSNQDSSMGTTLASYVANPLQIETEPGLYDGISPLPIVLNINIADIGDTTVTLSWAAPYDDGTSGGRVASYDLRYSPFPVDTDTLAWWEAAVQVTDEPAPSDPGTTESYTVTCLSMNTTYYFGIVAEDDAGNRSPLTHVVNATTVPVVLLSFTASVDGGIVTLHWATASETNSYGFEVQRSTGNKMDFRKIGFVEGAGTTAELRSYNFTDDNVPSGTHYYRLKQIDTEGSFRYFEPIEVEVTAPLSFTLEQNYPNPFNAKTEIHYRVAKPGRVTIKIYNLLAQEIRTLVDEEKEAGHYTVLWDARDDNGNEVASGIYIYQMRSGNFFQLRKTILLR